MVDSDLQRPGLEEQQRTEGVEQRLQGLWQVGLLVRYEPRRQRVLFQLLHRHIRQCHADGLQHRQRENGVIRFRERICSQTRRTVTFTLRT